MNYRHIFHAGNFADVFKHTLLIGLIEAFKAKTTPFCYIDTHAGRGGYDLRSAEALKTGEFTEGIQSLLGLSSPPALLGQYVSLVHGFNDSATEAVSYYPGSPLIASQLLREQDRAILCELQEQENTALSALFHGNKQVTVHNRDGYSALKALLPPKERRGLVLIDPPFEAQEQEFRVIESALTSALQRWATGVYAVWYPIKIRHSIQPFYRWLKACTAKNVLIAELLVRTDNSSLRLNGCGMAILNPPWQFDRQLEEILPVLAQLLGDNGQAQQKVEWLLVE